MNSIFSLLQAHMAVHPQAQVQDAIKFLYQGCMGPGHLVPQPEQALQRLKEEWDTVTPAPDAPLYEAVSEELVRLDLGACKALGLSPATVNRLFCLTANSFSSRPEQLRQTLSLFTTLSKDAAQAVEAYLAQGCPAVSHSDDYRKAYRPAYRVVYKRYVNYIELLAELDCRTGRQERLTVAIDGPCASGKSTLADLLAEVYGCSVVHMDDFFLRPEQRTPQRLEQAGGNVDYERVLQEVLLPLSQSGCAVYRPWNCRSGSYAPAVTLTQPGLLIVEGSYSLHPTLRGFYDLRVWIQADWDTRRKRILQRDGADCLSRFENLWVPLEDLYFGQCGVRECCQICVSGNEMKKRLAV